MRIIPALVFAALFGILAYALTQTDEVTAPEASHLVDKSLPVISLEGLGNAPEFSATSQQVQVLNIFASWCTPCIAELPELGRLREQTTASIIGIAWHDTPENIKSWRTQHAAPYHAIYHDADQQTGVKLGIRGVPETFIIDKQGIVRYHHIGPIDPHTREAILTPLIKEYSR